MNTWQLMDYINWQQIVNFKKWKITSVLAWMVCRRASRRSGPNWMSLASLKKSLSLNTADPWRAPSHSAGAPQSNPAPQNLTRLTCEMLMLIRECVLLPRGTPWECVLLPGGTPRECVLLPDGTPWECVLYLVVFLENAYCTWWYSLRMRNVTWWYSLRMRIVPGGTPWECVLYLVVLLENE